MALSRKVKENGHMMKDKEMKKHMGGKARYKAKKGKRYSKYKKTQKKSAGRKRFLA